MAVERSTTTIRDPGTCTCPMAGAGMTPRRPIRVRVTDAAAWPGFWSISVTRPPPGGVGGSTIQAADGSGDPDTPAESPRAPPTLREATNGTPFVDCTTIPASGRFPRSNTLAESGSSWMPSRPERSRWNESPCATTFSCAVRSPGLSSMSIDGDTYPAAGSTQRTAAELDAASARTPSAAIVSPPATTRPLSTSTSTPSACSSGPSRTKSLRRIAADVPARITNGDSGPGCTELRPSVRITTSKDASWPNGFIRTRYDVSPRPVVTSGTNHCRCDAGRQRSAAPRAGVDADCTNEDAAIHPPKYSTSVAASGVSAGTAWWTCRVESRTDVDRATTPLGPNVVSL